MQPSAWRWIGSAGSHASEGAPFLSFDDDGAVTHQTAPSLFHGFWNTTGSIPVARAAVEQATATLAKALARN